MKFISVPHNLSQTHIEYLKEEIEKARTDPDHLIIVNYSIEFQDLPVPPSEIKIRRRPKNK